MAWTFVGVSNVVEVTATSHPLVTTGITGLAAGDLLVACISSRIASTTSVTLPTGGAWTLVSEQKNNNVLTTSSALPSGVMAYAIRGASDPNLTFTHPVAPAPAIGRIVAYRDVNTASPKDTQTSFTTATAITAVSGTGLTTTQANDLIVAMAAGGQEAAWSAFNATSPAGASGTTVTADPALTWQERADSLTTTGNDTSLAIFDAVKLTAGATGNLTATASVSAGHVVIAGAFTMAAGDAWNTYDKSVGIIVLSNNDKTATGATSTSGAVRSTTKHPLGTAGKYYAEFSLDVVGGGEPPVGIKDITAPLATNTSAVYVAPATGAIALGAGAIGSVGSSLVSGDIVCVAVDMGAERIWFRKGSGLWNNDAAANPATNTNGLDISSLANNDFALWHQKSSATAGRGGTVRTELAELTQSPLPSGFTSWMGEALSSVTHYTLTALTGAVALAGPSVKLAYGHAALITAGAIAFSGQNVTLTKSGPTIVAQPGAFNLAGQSVTLRVDRRMPVTAGAIALAGQNVTLAYGHKLQAGTGSFALAGQSVTLRSAYKLRALTGALTIAEQSVRLVYARKGLALTGAIAFSGQNVTLIHTLAAVNYTLSALPGVFTLASQSVTLRYAHKLLITTGTFALAGQPVTLRYGHKLLATVGTFALAGQNVTLFHARRLATLPTTVTLAGQNVTLRYSHKLQASAGAVVLLGQGVNITWSHEGIINYVMQPLTGTFALAGQSVGLRGATRMTPTTGAVALSGKSVTLRVGYKTQAATGAFTLSGTSVALRLNRLLGATAGAYVLSGKTVTLRYARKLQATTGAFALAGTSVNLAYGAGQKLTVLPGGIVLSGKPIRLIQGYTIPVAPGAIVFNGKLTQYIWHRTLKAGTGAFELSRLSAGFDAPIAQPGVIRMGHARVYLKRW